MRRNTDMTKLKKFVNDRLRGDDTGTVHVKFNDPLKKSNALTYHDLYKKCSSIKKKNTDKMIKEDRDIMQRLITAYEADRPVDLSTILCHELSKPVALVDAEGKMRTDDKASLLQSMQLHISVHGKFALRQQHRLVLHLSTLHDLQ